LTLSGDGSALPSGASPAGRPTCDCRQGGLFRCDCPRLYSDPSADWGFDSYRDGHFFGHRFYQHLVSSAGYDLPVHLTIGPASESDFTLSLNSLDRFLKTCREHDLRLSVHALAYDAGHDARGIYEFLLAKQIRPVIALNPRSGQHPLPSGTAQQLNDQGVPLCPAGLPMRRHSTTPSHRIVFNCPVKRPTHRNGQHAWNASPQLCPFHVLCQPDTKMGPVVYVRSDADPRHYPPIPRDSSHFKQIMNLRSGCERSNSTKKVVYRLGRRLCRSDAQFLFRLYLVSLLEHARAWLAEDRLRLGKHLQPLSDPVLINAQAGAP
ncbi:MAG TPA: transposase, partial [Desulfurivibrionaceae bacterium]|nr:transposase [Desulfurivibrionaceae bacterium]